MRPFRIGPIDGIVWKPLRKFCDARGWLCELFRHDELPNGFSPAMAYISETLPGVCRGPHEHREQTDCFCFFGPSNFEIRLWDNRSHSPTYWTMQTAQVGADNPMMVIVPPGIVHAYRNVGAVAGLIVNCPDRLYGGEGRKEPIDEIRHERDPASPFRMIEE
jgi:dTDP-4-dehydrorhamnose 3,5-epimerase